MATIGRYTCWPEMGYGAIRRQMRELQAERHLGRPCRQRTWRYCNNRIEYDHCHVKSGACTRCRGRGRQLTAWAVTQGIEAAQILHKGRCSASRERTYTGKHGCSLCWVQRTEFRASRALIIQTTFA
jgi:hypothetical protein